MHAPPLTAAPAAPVGALCACSWGEGQADGGLAGGEEREGRAEAALDECCRHAEDLGAQFYPNDNRWADECLLSLCVIFGWVGERVGGRFFFPAHEDLWIQFYLNDNRCVALLQHRGARGSLPVAHALHPNLPN